MAEAATRVRMVGAGTFPTAAMEPPRWVLEAVAPVVPTWRDVADGLAVREVGNPGVRLVSARVRDFLALDADGVQRRTGEVYNEISARVDCGSAQHPVRVWNFIPGILAPLGSLEHRYMAFNAAVQAYEGAGSPAGRASNARCRPRRESATTAPIWWSTVSPRRGRGAPVENPRQVPS